MQETHSKRLLKFDTKPTKPEADLIRLWLFLFLILRYFLNDFLITNQSSSAGYRRISQPLGEEVAKDRCTCHDETCNGLGGFGSLTEGHHKTGDKGCNSHPELS